MHPSQQKAIDRVVGYYRQSSSDSYAVHHKVEDRESGYIYLTVELKWLGDDNQIGSDHEDRGTFLIGKRGGITVISAFNGWLQTKDNKQHIAFMLNASISGKTSELQRRPSRHRGHGKTAKVWELADANPTLTRTEIIELAVQQGINRNTASTQYGHWLRMERACGRRQP